MYTYTYTYYHDMSVFSKRQLSEKNASETTKHNQTKSWPNHPALPLTKPPPNVAEGTMVAR